MKLAGKVAIVTAAAGAGIGQAVARALGREGADVVVSSRRTHHRLFEAAENIKTDFGVKTIAIQCDVSDREQVENMVRRSLDEFGRIDILVNNAGVEIVQPVADMTDEAWDQTIKVNLSGTFYCCRAVLPTMLQQKSGRIVNISSVSAWACVYSSAAYCAAKAGVLAFTKVLANEMSGRNITVNAVAPGLIWNPYLARIPGLDVSFEKVVESTPVRRKGIPEDVANAVLFLVSDDASFVTGETINVSGGAVMH